MQKACHQRRFRLEHEHIWSKHQNHNNFVYYWSQRMSSWSLHVSESVATSVLWRCPSSQPSPSVQYKVHPSVQWCSISEENTFALHSSKRLPIKQGSYDMHEKMSLLIPDPESIFCLKLKKEVNTCKSNPSAILWENTLILSMQTLIPHFSNPKFQFHSAFCILLKINEREWISTRLCSVWFHVFILLERLNHVFHP